MRRTTAAILGIAFLLAAAPAGAGSEVNRKSPPRLSLRHQGEVVQRATPFTFCWSYSNREGGGTGMCADGLPRYPKAVQVEAPARFILRIHYPARPGAWFLRAYRAIVRHDGYDEAVGEPEDIPFKMRPRRRNGRVKAWDLVFRLTEGMRHYYIDTGGDLEQGDAFYALHVRTI